MGKRKETPEEEAVGLPDGFEAAGSERNAPWWLVKQGAELQGYLLGRFKMSRARKGSSGVYFQVKLTKPCEGITGKGEDQETVACEPGMVVNVGDKFQLTSAFNPLIESGGKWEIFARCMGKEEVGENEMWVFKTGKKMISPPPEKGDDIPF